MENYINELAQTTLFGGIKPNEIIGLLDCIHARRIEYVKDELIVEEGSEVNDFGIMLSGHGRSIKWDATDKVIIMTLLQKGSEIGILLAASLHYRSPVSVQALDDVNVLHIPYSSVLARCENACPWHDKLLRNYISIVAQKGLVLHERMNCLLKPTIREKILVFLSRISCEQQNRSFTIQMNRNAMAEYLNVERSALSRELSHMKRDGLIDYHLNNFKLLTN